MMIPSHVKCNNYSIFINMKKKMDQSQVFIFDLLRTLKGLQVLN
jgi:hypothetical protein